MSADGPLYGPGWIVGRQYYDAFVAAGLIEPEPQQSLFSDSLDTGGDSDEPVGMLPTGSPLVDGAFGAGSTAGGIAAHDAAVPAVGDR